MSVNLHRQNLFGFRQRPSFHIKLQINQRRHQVTTSHEQVTSLQTHLKSVEGKKFSLWNVQKQWKYDKLFSSLSHMAKTITSAVIVCFNGQSLVGFHKVHLFSINSDIKLIIVTNLDPKQPLQCIFWLLFLQRLIVWAQRWNAGLIRKTSLNIKST